MGRIVSVSEAVEAALNAGTFSQPVPAEKLYQPVYDLGEITTLKVSVIPKSLENSIVSRAMKERIVACGVVVQKKVTTEGQIDALVNLCEEINDYFLSNPLPGYTQASCHRALNDPVYDPVHLLELKQFTAVVTLFFKEIA